jgi:hypothetical protein
MVHWFSVLLKMFVELNVMMQECLLLSLFFFLLFITLKITFLRKVCGKLLSITPSPIYVFIPLCRFSRRCSRFHTKLSNKWRDYVLPNNTFFLFFWDNPEKKEIETFQIWQFLLFFKILVNIRLTLFKTFAWSWRFF